MNVRRTVPLAGGLAAFVAVGALLIGGGSAASAKGLTSVIKIKNDDNPRFVAPDSVPLGADLQIINKTDPNKIGPHTFSLVERDALPRTREEMKKCSQLKLVCRKIAKAHEVDLETFEVGQPNVENGKPGWDASFDGEKVFGDSWYTETQGETTSRQVTAETGNLWFFCAVHPFMQGKTKVLVP